MIQSRTVALPGSTDVIVLFDVEAMMSATPGRASYSNLARVTENGRDVWRATPPDQTDYFLDFALSGDTLRASTFSGYQVRVDLRTGALLATKFIK
jgi:hypothetical protein